MFLQADAAAGGIFGMLFPFILMFVVFYFLLLRPQQKQQKQRKELLDSLKTGDKVVTVGGIHGQITALKDDFVTLKIAEKVEVRVNRSGIGYKVKG